MTFGLRTGLGPGILKYISETVPLS